MKRQSALSNQMIKKINEQILFIQLNKFEGIAALLKKNRILAVFSGWIGASQ